MTPHFVIVKLLGLGGFHPRDNFYFGGATCAILWYFSFKISRIYRYCFTISEFTELFWYLDNYK